MPRSGRTHVYLSVYELLSFGKYNPYLMPIGLGAYHTGVEIYGEEISYGYHDSHTSGIFSIEPQSAPECRYVEGIFVGETDVTYEQLTKILSEMGNEYLGSSYNIFLKNCNHFTADLVRRLTGQSIPGYTNRLASLGYTFKCFLPIDSRGQDGNVQTPNAVVPVDPGHRLTDDLDLVALDSDDLEQRRSLLAGAAAKRTGK